MTRAERQRWLAARAEHYRQTGLDWATAAMEAGADLRMLGKLQRA